MRSLICLAVARSFARTARKSLTWSSAITEPLPESKPLQPITSELISQELCVVSTFTGGLRDCSARIWRSCSRGLSPVLDRRHLRHCLDDLQQGRERIALAACQRVLEGDARKGSALADAAHVLDRHL